MNSIMDLLGRNGENDPQITQNQDGEANDNSQSESESEQEEPELNANQVIVTTMQEMLAKLTNITGRIEGLENSMLTSPKQGGVSPAVFPNSQMQGQNVVTSTPVAQNQVSSMQSHKVVTSSAVAQTPVLPSTPGKVVSDVRTKLSDIKILELSTLQCLDSSAKLQMFFEAVERCAGTSDGRIEVAKARVDGELSVMIHTAQRRGEIKEWGECKAYLTREFGTDMNFEQAWRRNDTFHYEWVDSPQSFVHKFKCHYAAIQDKFHDEVLPNRDKLLKRKLLQGFPRNSRDVLEAFMDDNITLGKFLGHVESERAMLLKHHSSVNAVPRSSVEDHPPSSSRRESQGSVRPKSAMSTSTDSDNKLSELTARLDQLQRQMYQSSVARAPSAPRKFCAFCQTDTHFLRDCWRKPERGQCFDCLRHGCHRGNPSCPGKAARPPPSRSTNPHEPSSSSANPKSIRNTHSE